LTVCIISAVLIGGFLPTFSIEVLVFGVPYFFATLTAGIDGVQAGIWVVIAIIIAQNVVDPILLRYRKTNSNPE
jgi:hypothetical protein